MRLNTASLRPERGRSGALAPPKTGVLRGGAAPSPTPSLLEAVRIAVRQDDLVQPGDRVLVAVSGGADSVALLHLLRRLAPDLGCSLTVAHVDHGLRPAAAADARFVEEMAMGLGYPVVVERVVVDAGAGRSLEAAAREARHAALVRAARRLGANRIALGHSADDQAETVLMRVLQGAGPRGLAGIPARRGRLVRPLLGVARASVEAYLRAEGIPWVEDPTNQAPRFLRNRVRHDWLPLLTAQVGPHVGDALRRTARACRETSAALDALVAPSLPRVLRPAPVGWTLDVASLQDMPVGAVKALLRLAFARLVPLGPLGAGLRATHLDALVALLSAGAGARVRLPDGLVVERGRVTLWIGAPASDRPEATTLRVPGETKVRGSCLVVAAEVAPFRRGRTADPRWEAWLDAGQLPAALEIRTIRPNDRLLSDGARESVRASRILRSAGHAGLLRARWPVLARTGHSGPEVLWVIGARQGRAVAVTPETRTMLRLQARLVERWRPDGGAEGDAPAALDGDQAVLDATTLPG